MMLQTGNPNVRFLPRKVEGAKETDGREPERLPRRTAAPHVTVSGAVLRFRRVDEGQPQPPAQALVLCRHPQSAGGQWRSGRRRHWPARGQGHQELLFAARDLPYRTQFVPLASALAVLGDAAETDGARAQLTRWYWCGVFGELYGGATESRFAKDIAELVGWVRREDFEPSTVSDANFVVTRLLTLRTRNSAAYKGIHALLLKEGGLDFRTGDTIDVQSYFDEKIDIHHVFPQKWCKDRGLDQRRYNSIVNKTPISAKTNRSIGGSAPSAYLSKLEKHAGISLQRMDEILGSHLLDPAALRAVDFEAFFEIRSRAC